ncbi:hypothetical protein, partial [Enterobacter hormaechei]|uniref:hypothetical protein n=1 Tax=Enterobacter hormaechei TaxID=158836 RepID=UPI001952A93F
IALALSISAKLSMVLVVPFILIFLYRNNRYPASRLGFIAALAVTLAIVQAICFLSPGARAMILGTPLVWRLLDAAIPFSDKLVLYIFPLVYT